MKDNVNGKYAPTIHFNIAFLKNFSRQIEKFFLKKVFFKVIYKILICMQLK